MLHGRALLTLHRQAEIIADLQQSKYQMTEYRISIYGRYAVECYLPHFDHCSVTPSLVAARCSQAVGSSRCRSSSALISPL